MSRSRFWIVNLCMLLAVCLLMAGCAQPQPAPESDAQPSDQMLDGEALLQDRCTQCHGLEQVTNKTKNADEWAETVIRMVGKGATLNDDEQATLIEYLTANYGP